MFTQLNQYHVVLEVKPGFQTDPLDLRNLFIRSAAGSTGNAGLVTGGSVNTAGFGPSSSSVAQATAGQNVGAPVTGATSGAFSGGPSASSLVLSKAAAKCR